jgi:hypothetical protein
MNIFLEKVQEFHKLFGAPIHNFPFINKERVKLRIALLQEELNELAVALDENDVTETMDALCDLQYVLSGTVLELGMGKAFDDCFGNVHDSNMSKGFVSVELAEIAKENYESLGMIGLKVHPVDDLFVLKREDGKVLKNPNYIKADLAPILDKTYNSDDQIHD